MKNKLSLWVGSTFIVYLGIFLILQLTYPKQTFSELENRALASKPQLSLERILDGRFTSDYETYIADQFPLRNRFITLKSNTERILQKKEVNGVFIGADGYLLQNFSVPDMERTYRNAGYINTLADSFNVYVALVPTATKIAEDKLPKFATPYDEGQYISDFYSALSPKVYKVPVLETLISAYKEGQDLYYKTDHHWTTLGAYYGYTSFCNTAHLIATAFEDFTVQTVSTDFYGSLFSKGNFTYLAPDSVQIFYPKNKNPLTITYELSGNTKESLYNYDYLNQKDKYSIFLDGNHPLIRIKTSTKNGRKLLVIKDSYANCMIPFLTAHYEEIQIIDLRMANFPIQTYATENQIDDILLLYNVQNFCAEGKLSLLTK